MSSAFTSVVDYNTNKYDNLIIGAKTNDLGGNSADYVSKAVGGKRKSKKTGKKRGAKKTGKKSVSKTKKRRFYFF
jgi:hypothetical protein